ncbi:DUF1223 domain-containing protein [Oryzibacter oryziterrae]|uniref:DUF1223 domain-containing protein n=1 Tax=Oryzibacter oryziterrae TaxID=2766474 RepID=UPI001F28E2D7|nr:DUF1223 domain-containing protein [Oryzibacter oryziterrae]
MTSVVLATCCVGLTSVATPALADPSVVELFTSQGCSSCPPADEILGKLANDPNLIAVSFAVDYWDYLGWKDGFAHPEFTKRQRAYAKARGDRAVFTPQVVINGREAVVGSREDEIRASIDRMKADALAPSVPVLVKRNGDHIVVSVQGLSADGRESSPQHAALWIANYVKPQTVTIGSGENVGKKVTYYNIINRWQVLGMWDGGPMTVELALSDIATDDSAGLAVILQSKDDGMPGPILGAAKLDLQSGT